MAVMAVEAVPMAASAAGAGAAGAGAAGGAAAGGASTGAASGAAARGGAAKGASKAGPSLNETLGQSSLLGGGGGGGQKKEGGKKSSAKKSSSPSKSSKSSRSSKSGNSVGMKLAGKVGNRKSLLAELVICLVILLLGSLVRKNDDGRSSVVRMMVKGSALLGVFFVLSIMSTGGSGAQKASGAIGLLVVMTYALTSEDINNILKWIKSFFKPGVEKAKDKDDDTKDQSSVEDSDTGEPPKDTTPPSMEV